MCMWKHIFVCDFGAVALSTLIFNFFLLEQKANTKSRKCPNIYGMYVYK